MECRACGGSDVTPYLDLGATPLANSYLTEEQLTLPEERFPLAVAWCSNCWLSQLTHVVEPDKMFRNYPYVSSTSQTFRDHLHELADTAIEVYGSHPSLVLDIGSNDGYLLSCFANRGVPVIGVDPARNLAQLAAARGVQTITEYWGSSHPTLAALKPSIITATNVLAHVDNLKAFCQAVGRALGPDGLFIAEVPYLPDLIQNNEFDTIYHEHLSYFTLHSLVQAVGLLVVTDVQHFPGIHGGTMRVFIQKKGRPSTAVLDTLAEERAQRYGELATYTFFARRVARIRNSLLRLLTTDLAGKTIWAYGASAKGNTLMNYCGLDSSVVPVVVDDNPLKQGFYTPGAHMEIRSPRALQDNPDYLLLLAWNFEEEIVRRARAAWYRGRFIVPIPEPVIV